MERLLPRIKKEEGIGWLVPPGDDIIAYFLQAGFLQRYIVKLFSYFPQFGLVFIVCVSGKTGNCHDLRVGVVSVVVPAETTDRVQ